jgi:hypothetical protein
MKNFECSIKAGINQASAQNNVLGAHFSEHFYKPSEK